MASQNKVLIKAITFAPLVLTLMSVFIFMAIRRAPTTTTTTTQHIGKSKPLIGSAEIFPHLGNLSHISRDSSVSKKCPERGNGSAAPLNQDDFDQSIKKAVSEIELQFTGQQLLHHPFSSAKGMMKSFEKAVILYTVINAEAGTNNLFPFYQSLANLDHPLTSLLIVICLDRIALKDCEYLHKKGMCVFMDLGISNSSLAPGFNDAIDKDYWRLTYGRVYVTLRINDLGFSVLALDVDTIFLKNPLLPEGAIGRDVHSIAIVEDMQPFNINVRDGALINGGFLYFPATTPESKQRSREIIRAVWDKSCILRNNEQIMTTQALRAMHDTTPTFVPNVLPRTQFLSFCNTKCGGKMFEQSYSVADLEQMDAAMTGSPSYSDCERSKREKWVFFHTACIRWPEDKKEYVSKGKGKSQRAVYAWLTTPPSSIH